MHLGHRLRQIEKAFQAARQGRRRLCPSCASPDGVTSGTCVVMIDGEIESHVRAHWTDRARCKTCGAKLWKLINVKFPKFKTDPPPKRPSGWLRQFIESCNADS